MMIDEEREIQPPINFDNFPIINFPVVAAEEARVRSPGCPESRGSLGAVEVVAAAAIACSLVLPTGTFESLELDLLLVVFLLG